MNKRIMKKKVDQRFRSGSYWIHFPDYYEQFIRSGKLDWRNIKRANTYAWKRISRRGYGYLDIREAYRLIVGENTRWNAYSKSIEEKQHHIGPNSKQPGSFAHLQYLIGVDVAAGGNGDNSAMCVVL